VCVAAAEQRLAKIIEQNFAQTLCPVLLKLFVPFCSNLFFGTETCVFGRRANRSRGILNIICPSGGKENNVDGKVCYQRLWMFITDQVGHWNE
jgi:hypothetical protein